MTRTVAGGIGAVMGVIAWTAAAEAASADRTLRPVRLLQDIPDIGLSAGVTAEADGGLAVTASAGELRIRKQVYADGRFVVYVATSDDDRLLVSGTTSGLRVAYGSEPAVQLRAGHDSEYEASSRRVRGWLARSEAVQRFRRIHDALERLDARAPESLSLRVTGALVAELLGDSGAAERLGRSIAGRGAPHLRKAQSGYTTSCWDTYQRLVMAAASQLESCYASFSVFNPLRQVCSFIWTLQVESAWFQFLSCSSIPMK